jgi:diguanylate cyclase (GGDEF)-like protein/PAS domain S-box-containing protein
LTVTCLEEKRVYQESHWPSPSTPFSLSRTVRDVIERTSDCVFVLDSEWRFTYLNRRARSEIAPNGQELVGQVIWDVFPEALGTAFEQEYRRASSGQEEVCFEGFFEPLAAWYEVRASPIRGGGLSVWFRNINERRDWVEALSAAGERFRLAAKATQDLIFDWDIRSGRLDWQETHNPFLGFSHEELGHDVGWLMQCVHPDDRARLEAYTQQVIEGEGNQFVCDYRILTKAGGYADVLAHGFLARNQQGRAVRMVGAVQDNTKRNAAARALREREAHLSSVFGQAMVGIMHRDADGSTVMVNDRFCEILGRSRAQLSQLRFEDYTHPDDLAWNLPLHQEKSTRGEPFQIEKRYLRPDGSAVWCEVNVSFLKNDSGQTPSAIVVAQDITARKHAEEALRKNSQLLQTVIDSVQDLIFVKDRDGRFVLANKALSDGCGSFLGSRTLDCFPVEMAAAYDAHDCEVIASGGSKSIEEMISIQGTARLFQTVKVPWREEGDIAGVIGVSRDITDRKASETALRESELLYRSVLEASADCIAVLDLDGTIKLANDSALLAMGASSLDQIRGTPWSDHWPQGSRAEIEEALARARLRGTSRFSTRATREATTWWDVVVSPMCGADGEASGILAIARDTTLQRETSAKLKWASEHDALTGLPNRRAFQARLQAAILRSMDSQGAVGLLLLDLDHFKHINDTLGHAAGDHLLAAFGKRLKQTLRAEDFVARLGGDEFAVIIEDTEDQIDLAAAGAAIRARLEQPVELEGRMLSASASLGGAVYPDDASNANELFENADIALYALKGSGRGGTRMFVPPMREQARVVSSQLDLARVSLGDDAIEPHYQQKVDLKTGAIVGFEALLRFHHSHRGLQLPATVAEAFKDYGLASQMSAVMQNRVFADVQRWTEQRLPVGRISINAAPVEFLRDDFAERMIARMEARGIAPDLIELEVTEHVFLERGSDFVGRALRALHQRGVRIALDDFGTGYSSLSHLRDFPVDVVKIDRSFVEGMSSNAEMMAIVEAVIKLAANLAIEVVAEGIETEEQRRLLVSHGCPLGQGYLFGRPVAADMIGALVAQRATDRAA